MENKPTEIEIKLLNEVGAISEGELEQYIEGWQHTRKLGEVLLKAVSRIESECDELIISWNEKVDYPGTLDKLVYVMTISLKYKPLLSKMYFLQKVDSLADYKLLKKGKGLHKKLAWLNDRRNKFAHYGVYRFELQHEYTTSNKRVEVLNKLKEILSLFGAFVKDVKELSSNPKVMDLIKTRYWTD